jgi:hypothetical protein
VKVYEALQEYRLIALLGAILPPCSSCLLFIFRHSVLPFFAFVRFFRGISDILEDIVYVTVPVRYIIIHESRVRYQTFKTNNNACHNIPSNGIYWAHNLLLFVLIAMFSNDGYHTDFVRFIILLCVGSQFSLDGDYSFLGLSRRGQTYFSSLDQYCLVLEDIVL